MLKIDRRLVVQAAHALPAMRPAAHSTARSRLQASRRGRSRIEPLVTVTAERASKGDLIGRAGKQIAMPVLERMRNRGQLDSQAHINEAMFLAGERLRRHHEACGGALRSLDLTAVKVRSVGWRAEDTRLRDAGEVRYATTLMGKSAKTVFAVAVDGMTVGAAAEALLGPGRAARIKGEAMDLLRAGLLTLALHWRLA